MLWKLWIFVRFSWAITAQILMKIPAGEEPFGLFAGVACRAGGSGARRVIGGGMGLAHHIAHGMAQL